MVRHGRLSIAVVGVAAMMLPTVSFANHFDTSSSTGSFDPQFRVAVETPIEGRSSNLQLTVTQQDHEDPIRAISIKAPAEWHFGVDQLRPAQKADGTTNDFDCGASLGPSDANGLEQVARAEIVGKIAISAVSDVTAPRTQAVTWNGDLYWLSWNPAPIHNLTVTTGIDTATGKAYIQSTWDPDLNLGAGTYRFLLRRTGEAAVEYLPTSNSLTVDGLEPGVEYNVIAYYPSEARPPELAQIPVVAGSGVVGPRGTFCGQMTTQDQRVWNLYNSPARVDVRQLNFGFQLRRGLDGRWEIPGDLRSLWSDTNIQAAQASLVSLDATLFADSKGNWHTGGSPPSNQPLVGSTRNPAIVFSEAPWKAPRSFEATFHPCHQHPGGSASPCGATASSGRMDVTKTSVVQLYPGHARPVVASPQPWDVLIGSNTSTIVWGPHRYSDPPGDAAKGLSGYAVRVVPMADASNPTACPASAVYCRPPSDPILVGESSPSVIADAAGGVTLTVTTPQDGWFAYRITALYRDGHTSDETELAAVKGSATGNFYTSSTPWPFIYLDRSVPNRPMVLFIDPQVDRFSLVLTNRTLSFTDPNMIFVGSENGDGSGAFDRFQQGSYYGNNINVAMVFQPEEAKGVYTFEASAGTATGRFIGTRIR